MLSKLDKALFERLESAPDLIRQAVKDASNMARASIADAGFPVSFSDPHAALDAAVYRYMVESAQARKGS